MENKLSITAEAVVHAPVEVVWQYFTEPEHITKWNFATEEWHCPKAENNLNNGGRFVYRMEAKDGSFGFDFSGNYDDVIHTKQIKYSIDDGRKVEIHFINQDDTTKIVETFEAETQNDIELQKAGWQAILDNFKKYVEEN